MAIKRRVLKRGVRAGRDDRGRAPKNRGAFTVRLITSIVFFDWCYNKSGRASEICTTSIAMKRMIGNPCRQPVHPCRTYALSRTNHFRKCIGVSDNESCWGIFGDISLFKFQKFYLPLNILVFMLYINNYRWGLFLYQRVYFLLFINLYYVNFQREIVLQRLIGFSTRHLVSSSNFEKH